MVPNQDYLQSLRSVSIKGRIPRRITKLIQIMYGKLCSSHNHPLNRAHLAEHHEINVDPIAMIKGYTEGNTIMTRARIQQAIVQISGLTRSVPRPG